MRRFALTSLVAIVLLNCFLAYSGHALSVQLRQLAADKGIKLPLATVLGLAAQPCFCLIAASAVVAAMLGWSRKLGDRALIYLIVGLLVFDIAALFTSQWGAWIIKIPIGERIVPSD